MSPFTLEQRQKFITLVAATGSIPNLNVALEVAGCPPRGEALGTAAANGHKHVSRHLLQRGCSNHNALTAAAKAGCLDACVWLLLKDCDWTEEAVCAAARAGHDDVVEGLLMNHPSGPSTLQDVLMDTDSVAPYLEAAAAGCSLATLQRLHDSSRGTDEEDAAAAEWPLLTADELSALLRAAADSATPDWQAKVLFVEGLTPPGPGRRVEVAVTQPDVAARLAWLQGRGHTVGRLAAAAAAGRGDMTTLQQLLADGGAGRLGATVAEAAAAGGAVEALELLAARGCRVNAKRCALAAAAGGHVALLAWLVEQRGLDVRREPGLLATAAKRGDVALLAWLRERGCPWDEQAVSAAAEGGCVAALEWLVERGCPVQSSGEEAYFLAARGGDLATLRCLRRLGCPWGEGARLFERCVARCAVPVLAWLLDAGCPVDWVAVARAMERAAWEVQAWLVGVKPELRQWQWQLPDCDGGSGGSSGGGSSGGGSDC